MKIVAGIISVLLLTLNSCHRDPSVVNAQIHANEVYGPDERNKMGVYLPVQHDSNSVTVMLIHGGGWVAGNKTDWGSDFINTIIQQGYGVAAINYRYANGDFHNQMKDIRMAVEHINTKSNEWNIGSGKFALIGGSAGGHLALLYAHAFDSAQQVKAVISLVGPTDMTDTVFHRYADNYNIGFVFEQFLGSSYQANPAVYKEASPIYNYSNVPTLFIHGKLDDLVPPTQGIRMFDTLHVHGIATDTTIFANAGHDVFGPNGANKQQVYNEITAWLQTYLR